jgi:TetR/AcrR family transcriptional regulator, mexCD-oprJ operon repressor
MGVMGSRADAAPVRWPRMAAPTRDHRRATAEHNVEAILDAAEALLARGAQASISAVAKEAGVSRVTVYSHFPTRAELVEAVVTRVTRAATASIEEAKPGEGDPMEALERVITVAWDELERQEAIRRATAEELSPEAVWRAHRSPAQTVRRLIERGRRAGTFRKDLPVQWMLVTVFTLLHAAADEVREGRLRPAAARAAVKTSILELFAA